MVCVDWWVWGSVFLYACNGVVVVCVYLCVCACVENGCGGVYMGGEVGGRVVMVVVWPEGRGWRGVCDGGGRVVVWCGVVWCGVYMCACT